MLILNRRHYISISYKYQTIYNLISCHLSNMCIFVLCVCNPCHWPKTFCAFLQKELSERVHIFEKKVDSYKKTSRNLKNAVTYIKVR